MSMRSIKQTQRSKIEMETIQGVYIRNNFTYRITYKQTLRGNLITLFEIAKGLT